MVNECRQQFEVLSAPLEGALDDVLEGNFINGLKAEIKVKLRLLSPRGLEHAMELAQQIEDKLTLMKRDKGPNGVGFNRSTNVTYSTKTQNIWFN